MLAPHLARNAAAGSHGSSFQASRYLKKSNRHDSYSSGSNSRISLPENRITPPTSSRRPYLSTIWTKKWWVARIGRRSMGSRIKSTTGGGLGTTYFRRSSRRSSESRPPFGDTSMTRYNELPFISYLRNVKPTTSTHCYSWYLISAVERGAAGSMVGGKQPATASENEQQRVSLRHKSSQSKICWPD
jgi:hypothetical protein